MAEIGKIYPSSKTTGIRWNQTNIVTAYSLQIMKMGLIRPMEPKIFKKNFYVKFV